MATTAEHEDPYTRLLQTFHLEVPATFNFATNVVDRWAEERNRVGMVWRGRDGERRTVTFREFANGSKRIANVFARHGIGRGENVVVVLSRIPAWWETLLALMRLGAVAVPGTTLLTGRDFVFRSNSAKAKAIVTDAENVHKVIEVRGQLETVQTVFVVGDAPAGAVNLLDEAAREAPVFASEPFPSSEPMLIYFTSGTTGYPKMVVHTHASYGIGHRVTGGAWLAVGPNDLHWTLSDTGWAKAAWGCFFGPWSQGAALFIHDAVGKFDPRLTLRLLEEEGVTSFCAPPTAYRVMVLEDLKQYRFPELRSCVGAGEPLNPEVIDIWREATGMTIRDGYGQTETVLLVGNFPGMEVRPGSMGKPSPGFEVAVIREDGGRCEPGEEGDIAVRVQPGRPVGLFKELWNAPEATALAVRGGWYITGDRAYTDADGYFWFVGRADDVIISAGYRIGPFEVESALVEHPAVAEAAVIGKPDPVRGEIVKAFVILAPGYQADGKLAEDLQEHVRTVTAPYKYPREVEFVAELPKTISGKIRRIELRETERKRLGLA